MAAITDLAAASSVGASDNLVINQSGTDRKVTADKFAVVGNANTFAAAQTFNDEINVRQHTSNNAWSIDCANGTPITVGNGVVFQFSQDSTFAGLVMLLNTSDGQMGVFACAGGQVSEISDVAGVYSKTKNTASSTNVYYETGQYMLQNNTGGSRVYYIFTIRMRAGS